MAAITKYYKGYWPPEKRTLWMVRGGLAIQPSDRGNAKFNRNVGVFAGVKACRALRK
ncbi:hypothetical protein P3C58_31750 [Mesorhizobium sp. XAP10]|uniref:hypothetical protein n=1 Tax=unclassified Mesorhizobium TaxID=325217 RepID=UPI0023DE7522|nr:MULTISPECIES: hypothetical protein [unclassified Mesorhizobium]MDF3156525.1 hypothetical protein [Mesorhizobium sp. XAP10]MDF3249387.1 hypothetical protein [Mesorhizobium sp. XAP4]